eukprot:67007_1
MFYELLASSHIQIPCHRFTGGFLKENEENKEGSHGNLIEEVMNHLLIEYCNKIIEPNGGLCITVSGIDKIGDARIFPEDGGTYVDVEYRLALFKPYNNEIIEGSIANSDTSGIRISLGFFEQIFIPKNNLPKQSTFDEDSKTWIWETEDQQLSFEKDDVIYFKVVKTEFLSTNSLHNQSKNKNKEEKTEDNDNDIDMNDNDSNNDNDNTNNIQLHTIKDKLLKRPMIVYGTLDGEGLGPSIWWE